MFQVPALRIQQKGATLFVTALPLAELKKHAVVDYWGLDNDDGYQRPLVDRRLAEVAKYLTQEQGVLPTSVLLCTRDGDPHNPTFTPHDDIGGFATSGTLAIHEETTLWLADGQHRLFGATRAYTKDDELASYPFPVTIMTDIDQYTEMEHFNIINTEQRKMPTDIADRHLVAKRKREGYKLVARGKKGDKEYQRARATEISDTLNEQPGPWFHEIAVPVKGKDKGLVRQHAVVASLEPVLRDPWLVARTEEELAKLVGRYWRALSEVWPEAFQDPSAYRVQATVGLYSLHMVLPTVTQLCLGEGDFSEVRMKSMWEETAITSKFWHKEYGDPYTVGTGMASIRALAHYFRDQLPKARAVSI